MKNSKLNNTPQLRRSNRLANNKIAFSSKANENIIEGEDSETDEENAYTLKNIIDSEEEEFSKEDLVRAYKHLPKRELHNSDSEDESKDESKDDFHKENKYPFRFTWPTLPKKGSKEIIIDEKSEYSESEEEYKYMPKLEEAASVPKEIIVDEESEYSESESDEESEHSESESDEDESDEDESDEEEEDQTFDFKNARQIISHCMNTIKVDHVNHTMILMILGFLIFSSFLTSMCSIVVVVLAYSHYNDWITISITLKKKDE